MTIAAAIPISGRAFASRSFQGDGVQNTAALTALLPGDRFDKQERTVEGPPLEQYFFDQQSSAASSPPDILVPDDSPATGRWVRHKPSGGTPGAHALAGAEHTADTLANLNSKVSDATLIDTGDSRLSDARTPTAHDLAGAEHNADTLANLNSKVSDATLLNLAGQLGGTAAFPDVRGIRETGGPTNLTLGTITDGEFLKRTGTTITSSSTGTGDLKADGTVPLTATWNVGGQIIGSLGGLTPSGDNLRDAGIAGSTWRFVYVNQLQPRSGGDLVIRDGIGTSVFKIDTGAAIFNETGADQDYRAEGNTDPNLFTTDGGLDRVGVGVAPGAHKAKFHVNGGILGNRDVEANTTTPKTIVAAESRRLFTNEGATVEIVHNLPSAVKDLEYSFCVQDADGIQINAAAGDTIRLANQVSIAAGFVESAVVGSCVRLVAINATEWVAENIVGVWDVETS